MRKIIERIESWLRDLRTRRVREREKRVRGGIVRESMRRIQVTEYAGELFMSFDGIPLVSEHSLRDGKKLPDYVQDCRDTWIHWQEERYEGEIVLHVDRSGCAA